MADVLEDADDDAAFLDSFSVSTPRSRLGDDECPPSSGSVSCTQSNAATCASNDAPSSSASGRSAESSTKGTSSIYMLFILYCHE